MDIKAQIFFRILKVDFYKNIMYTFTKLNNKLYKSNSQTTDKPEFHKKYHYVEIITLHEYLFGVR